MTTDPPYTYEYEISKRPLLVNHFCEFVKKKNSNEQMSKRTNDYGWLNSSTDDNVRFHLLF